MALQELRRFSGLRAKPTIYPTNQIISHPPRHQSNQSPLLIATTTTTDHHSLTYSPTSSFLCLIAAVPWVAVAPVALAPCPRHCLPPTVSLLCMLACLTA